MSETTEFTEADKDLSYLEEEGDIAADYLEELLDIADIDGDIDIEIRNGRTYLSVITDGEVSEELQALVGERGEVLDALQELVRLSVLAATGNRSRLILDIADYRADRIKRLAALAESAIAQVKETGEDYHMEPLGAYERKLVHDLVAENGLFSESEGEGATRHIVISLPED
ncbi:Jag family protein [Rothia aerolata]|uniref:Single-stranded DNA-binding protein n=1 Tax=Rothia aerolata TaxID=1812262 RepID=A0A917IX64_9MICC|nr:R3H domain-containing nucleic acid-binding protein [Rothia aerolata]GGH66574.1 single-stranded DNA-binding protein [Rothia aerolata]